MDKSFDQNSSGVTTDLCYFDQYPQPYEESLSKIKAKYLFVLKLQKLSTTLIYFELQLIIHHNEMIRIEVYCMLKLLFIFVISMLASLSHADIDSTYSLFAFYALLTHRHYNSIRQVLIILIAVTAVVILSDIWVLGLMQYENTSNGNKIFGYIWTVIELCLKVGLQVMLVTWKIHIQQEDNKRLLGEKVSYNVEEAN